jgi:hypothetical protein
MYVSMQFPVEMGTRRSDPDVVVWFQIGDGSLLSRAGYHHISACWHAH